MSKQIIIDTNYKDKHKKNSFSSHLCLYLAFVAVSPIENLKEEWVRLLFIAMPELVFINTGEVAFVFSNAVSEVSFFLWSKMYQNMIVPRKRFRISFHLSN